VHANRVMNKVNLSRCVDSVIRYKSPVTHVASRQLTNIYCIFIRFNAVGFAICSHGQSMGFEGCAGKTGGKYTINYRDTMRGDAGRKI
jgi:hypothetical protein